MAQIRPRTDDDLDACIALLHRVHRVDRYPVIGLTHAREFLVDDGVLSSWVAETTDGGQVVGQVSVSTASEHDLACVRWRAMHPGGDENDDDRIAVLGRLFVDPAHRGSGIAAKLVRTVEDWGRQCGRRLVLFVLAKNRSAEKLYRHLGWIEFASSVFRYGDGESMDAACFVSPIAQGDAD